MAITYVQIGNTVTVGAGGAASINFTSIPSTYTDLKLVLSARQSTAAVNAEAYIYVNADTSASYSVRTLISNGSATSSANYSGQSTIVTFQTPAASATSSTFGNAEIYIPNYSGATNKSISIDEVCETNATAADMRFMAALFAKTTAISSIYIDATGGGTFVQYSTATLYGIKNS